LYLSFPLSSWAVKKPDLVVDGEMQADTAVVPEIIEQRYPFSMVKDANILVFPSLESANIGYKLLARLGNAKAIGPILLGKGAPIHVLQIGDEVDSIVQVAAVAAMDAMSRLLNSASRPDLTGFSHLSGLFCARINACPTRYPLKRQPCMRTSASLPGKSWCHCSW